MVDFLIEKTQLHDRVRDNWNPRQEKFLPYVSAKGSKGFRGA